MSETGSSGPGAVSSSEDRALAFAGYVLLMLAPFTGGVSALISLFIALAKRKEVPPPIRAHLDNQLRLFRLPVLALGVCVLLAIAAAGAGWWLAALGVLLVIGTSFWSAVAALIGLVRLSEDRPPR
jgi:uncharacterized membrane protein